MPPLSHEKIRILVEDTIKDTIKETLPSTFKNHDAILEETIKRVLKEEGFKGCVIPFKNKKEEEEFIENIPEVINLVNNVDSAKKGAKRVFWIMIAIVVANIYDDIIQSVQHILDFIRTSKPTK